MSKYSKDAIAQFQILPWSDSIIVSEKMRYVIGLKNFFNVINDSSSLWSTYCGAFCVCFVLWVNDEVAFNNFSNCFKEDDLLINDKKLRQYFKCMIFRI